MRTGASGPLTGRGLRHPVPTIVFHGDEDTIVHPANADGFLCALQRSGPPLSVVRTAHVRTERARAYTRSIYRKGSGPPLLEEWIVHGAGHAWFGGSGRGPYSDAAGPDASREMIRFFFDRRRALDSAKAKA
jgi:poly(3-hydroxybutyrate) depolymerase